MLSRMRIDLDERKHYLGIDAPALAELADLRPLLERTGDDFTAKFYQHVLSFAKPRSLLTDDRVRDRLLASQKDYYISLSDPVIDDAYVERRSQIGHVHERVGLAPDWYIGAYSLYLNAVGEVIRELCQNDIERERRLQSALNKRLLFDLELAMDAYIDKRQEQLEFLNKELAASQRGLRHEVDEQRVVLHETEARARAAEQLASVGMLAAGLAHEIGTPMGVIRGHAESLEDAVSDEKSRWRVQTIVEQIDRITNIMQALLNLARPRDPVVQPVDLASVIETAVSFLREKLSKRNIEVRLSTTSADAEAGSWVVRGDVEKLQQLFLNLIMNAADAMMDGGTLTLEISAVGDAELLVRVVDTGIGIEPDQLARVFEPFFTTKQAGHGNGLGLVVARGIAIDHGGNLEVTSEVGHGTEFRLELPRVGDGSQRGESLTAGRVHGP